jgi:hypothetical protein
MSDKKCD